MRKIMVLSMLLAVGMSWADDWTEWRGPHGAGVANEGNYRLKFSSTEHVKWKVPLSTKGASTPVVLGDRIVLTSSIDRQDGVLCLDRKGKEQWRVKFGKEVPGKHKMGTACNSSPVVDDQRVYVYYKSGVVAAVDLGGKVVWTDNLYKRFGERTLWWDVGSSPVLAGSNVVFTVMQAGDSYLVALDRVTGKVAWKESRVFSCPTEADQAYTTPIVTTLDGRARLIVFGADHLTGHDAGTGKRLWAAGGFNPKQRKYYRAISSPVQWQESVVFAYGRGGSMCRIDIRDATHPDERWLWKGEAPDVDVPTPAVRDGRIYFLGNGGKLVCVNAADGKEQWATRLPRTGGYFASPILVGDRIYCMSDSGTLHVGRVGKVFELLASNEMGETVAATPVFVDGEILIRGFKHLFCISAEE